MKVDALADLILALCAERGVGRTICPSEVARRAAPIEADWRALMPAVRSAAARLAAQGRIRITQRGHAVDIANVRGPVRLGVLEDRTSRCREGLSPRSAPRRRCT